MQIWLGKQYLGQRDQAQTTNVLVNLTDAQLNARLQQLWDKATVRDGIEGPIIDGRIAEGNQQAGGDAVATSSVQVTGGARRVPRRVRARPRKTG
jgi:hypothetical protein